jgi:uncharacterized membrane protein
VKKASRYALALFFVTAGVFHFVFTARYEAIVPAWLPHAHALVIFSGWCEIAGGVAVLIPHLRLIARYGLIALCVAVLPANVQMVLDAISTGASITYLVLLWIRLPAQGLLIWWIWRATRAERS